MTRITSRRFPFALFAAAFIPALAVRAQTPLNDPIPGPIQSIDVSLILKTVTTGFTLPTYATFAPGHPARIILVLDLTGKIWQVDTRTGNKRVYLDVGPRLMPLSFYSEAGLLGLAFHPDFAHNGLFYLYTSEPADRPPDFTTLPVDQNGMHHSIITEWHVPNSAHPLSLPDTGSAREIMRIAQPQNNHNGGALGFGPDDKLYIALGDGGGSDDQGAGHSANGNGQDTGNVLGAILCIDPLGRTSPNGQYSVPVSNPFYPTSGSVGGSQGCEDGFCDEIFAYGFRNPYRFSFDQESGLFHVGDVGQNDIEELDLVVSGGNYGWRIKEGSFCFDPNDGGAGFVFECPTVLPAPNLIDPIAEYDHDEGVSIIGGFVYRGTAIPGLFGYYVFAEYAGNGAGGRIFVNAGDDGIVQLKLNGQNGIGERISGFGQDGSGEIYVLTTSNGLTIGTGKLLKLTP